MTQLLIKHASLPEDLRSKLRSFEPRTHVGATLRELAHYLPADRLDMLEELIDYYLGSVFVESELGIVVLRPNPESGIVEREDLGIVSRKVVTDNGVKNIVDLWNSAGSAMNLFKFVGLGTGTNAEAAADSALQTELTTEYTGNVRATGVISQPSNNVARVVATNTLDSGTPAVTETGLFSIVAAGILWDRFKYAAVNLIGANGDGMQSTINSTFTAGG